MGSSVTVDKHKDVLLAQGGWENLADSVLVRWGGEKQERDNMQECCLLNIKAKLYIKVQIIKLSHDPSTWRSLTCNPVHVK